MSARTTPRFLLSLVLLAIAAAPATRPTTRPGVLTIGMPEHEVRKLKPKVQAANQPSTDYSGTRHVRTIYELTAPSGAEVTCEKGKVTSLELEPTVGMAEADLLAWNQTLYVSTGALAKEPHCSWVLKSESGRRRGYVRGEGGEDYRILFVDLDTGKIAYMDK